MKNICFYLLSLTIISLTSCRAFYQATPAPTPVLREKGDGNIFISPTDIQLAYAVTPHIGVIASGHLDKKGKSLFSDTSGYIAKLLDNNLEDVESKGKRALQAGVMYIRKLDMTKSMQVGMVIGTYEPSMMIKVSRGLLKKSTDEIFTYKCMKADLFLSYVHTSKYVDFITTVKFVGTQYNDIVYAEPLIMKELGKMKTYEYPTISSRYFFVEPSATIQYGFENFKFRMQGFMSQPLTDKTFAKDQFGVSLGLNYQFNIQKQVAQRRRPRV
jgi:hypothetical protein